MIFTPENCEKVLSGQKTMTRRVVHVGKDAGTSDDIDLHPWVVADPNSPMGFDIADNVPLSEVYSFGRLKYKLGREYAVQLGRGKKAVGRIRITAIRRERLQDIPAADCIREGATRVVNGEFVGPLTAFRAIWDSLYGDDPVKGWEANPDVWVISFELVS